MRVFGTILSSIGAMMAATLGTSAAVPTSDTAGIREAGPAQLSDAALQRLKAKAAHQELYLAFTKKPDKAMSTTVQPNANMFTKKAMDTTVQLPGATNAFTKKSMDVNPQIQVNPNAIQMPAKPNQ